MNINLQKLVKEIFEEGYLMSLGTVDDGGVWVADVIYIHDEDLNLYWLSLPDSRHSKVVENGEKIACSITSNWTTDDERGLQIEGKISKTSKNSSSNHIN